MHCFPFTDFLIKNVNKTKMTLHRTNANDIAQEIGASNWLTTLPIEEKGFVLSKQEFWDAINLRYNWKLRKLPASCACGARFDITHALICKKGGFISQRHNEIRDLTGGLLSEVYRDVCIEPVLTELTGETMTMRSANISSEARVDISARGIWSRGQRAFFDVRVFDPLARRYQNQTLKSAYRSHELEEKKSLVNEFFKLKMDLSLHLCSVR